MLLPVDEHGKTFQVLHLSIPFMPADSSKTCGLQKKRAPVILSHWNDVQALVDKLKSIGSIMTLATTKQGFLYLQVSAFGVQLASEVQGLEIVPAGARDDSSTAS